MLVIALAGGLGAGKSEAARFLESRGAFRLDLDDVAKRLIDSSSLRDELVAAFGDDILDRNGAIVPSRLAESAFRCDATTATLDAIVHPAVINEVERRLQDLALQARPPAVVVIEVPLLAEAPVIREIVDLVVSLEAPEDVRWRRSVARGMDSEDARRRIARQADDTARTAFADVMIVNDGTLDELRAALDELWRDRVERKPGSME